MADLPEIPLTILCGEPMGTVVTVLGDDGQPVPSSSISSARAQVRTHTISPTVLHEWTTTGGSPNAQIVSSGGVKLIATAVETLTWQTSWSTSTPRWDIVIVDNTGKERRLCAPSFVYLVPVLTR